METFETPVYNLNDLLHELVHRGGSDLHLSVGRPPMFRIKGKMVPIKDSGKKLTPTETSVLCYSALTSAQKARLENKNELDFSIGIQGFSRFRGNIFKQRNTLAAVFRTIPSEIPHFDELQLPAVLKQIAKRPKGLFLVTGPTGSGKSTTLAAIIDYINQTEYGHIITIEDPIEFLHPHKNCLINQREIGADTASFREAIRYILRQDPDVVLLGEMRDLETVEAALTIAETGHLCLATLHTNSATQTINRIVDMFDTGRQPQIRSQLAFVLEGVASQLLLPTADNIGRTLAMEILIPNLAIRSLIRDGKIHQLQSQMTSGQAKSGMQTMNQCLVQLLQTRQITFEVARARSADVLELQELLEKEKIDLKIATTEMTPAIASKKAVF